LEFLGLKLDPAKNENKEIDLSAEGSKAKILRIPTNEELVIALDTADIVSKMKAQ
ncbi:MAG: acetate kinase, partial [Ignavibacteriaceae bacterium]|nr:acetate kinase [Ignavibacteriaceae bacterium]